MNILGRKGWILLQDLQKAGRHSDKAVVLERTLLEMQENSFAFSPEDRLGIAMVATTIFCNKNNPVYLRVAAVNIVGLVGPLGASNLLKVFTDEHNEKSPQVRAAAQIAYHIANI